MRPVIATIRIVAQAKPADLFSAIDRALDAGSIQGAITDDTPIEITSALSEDEFDARRRYCDHTGLRVSRQRKRRTITRDDVVRSNEAMTLRRRARDLLEAAGAVQTVARVRYAIASAEGAHRHAEGVASRTPPSDALPASGGAS